jgi:hypothetical protein
MHQKLHTLYITVMMDKPCSKAVAARSLRDCIGGEFSCTAYEDGEPEAFQVRHITATAKRRRK